MKQLKTAEHDAAVKRHAADLAESKAFIAAGGSMDLRKHQARVETEQQEFDAKVAEAVVRSTRAQIRAVETRIDVGRSMNAGLRAELKTLDFGGGA